MCGICGLVHVDPEAPIGLDQLVAMRDIIAHRGPDDSGIRSSPCVTLAARRLAILDLSAEGHMPMVSADGRYSVAYNGEAYNYRTLRPSLEAKGYRFRSNSDTEVLLYLFADQGPAMLDWLDGMFAIAVWDEHERSLFLARDRLGVKPLYYAQANGAFYFASEQKALFAAGIPSEFDHGTWEELLCFRFVAGEETPYRGVRRLLPGHYLVWKDGHARTKRWWDLGERARALRTAPERDPAEWLRQTLDASVMRRLISDVPVGILLSGGLDSSCIAASVGAQGVRDVSAFCVRFREAAFDEGDAAAAVADLWGLPRHELFIEEASLLRLLRECTWLCDEPLAHANEPHLYSIAKFAKPHVTVLLSGEGADETMGGYVRYFPLRMLRSLAASRAFVFGLSRVVPKGSAGSVYGRIHKLERILRMGDVDDCVLYNSCEILPVDLAAFGMQADLSFRYRRTVLEEGKRLYPHEPVRQAMYLDQHTFLVSLLDRNDRTTMGASIECRVPFLSYRLVEGLAALPTRVLLHGPRNKSLLREAVGHRLPQEVIKHRKWGFGVPWHDYFRHLPAFRELIATVPELAPICDGPFDRSRLRSLVVGYLGGDLTHHNLIRQLLFIALWHQICVGQPLPPVRRERLQREA